jgi:putative transposase
MPRLPRLHVPGGYYHVILRGNRRQALFDSHQDRVALNNIVAESLEREGARLHIYCWMTNHLHAVIQVGNRPLGSLMHRIARRYSRYRNKQLNTTGHSFERRYKAWLVDADMYFFALLRYIHLNPVKARIVEKVDDYLWSSHHAYLGLNAEPWLTVEFGLGLMGRTAEQAQAAYRTLIGQAPFASEDRLHDDANPADQRILGTDRFIASLAPAVYKSKSRKTLADLTEEICSQRGLSAALVCSASRQRHLTAARVEIATAAADERIATLREVAQFFKRKPESISELLSRYRLR